MGALQGVQRDRPTMTDPISCPECGGAKGQQLGPLFLACQFCGGRGRVGGEHEPAEPPPPPDGPPPAWERRGWSALAAVVSCPYCFGSGRIPKVDRESRTMVMVPCGCQTGR